MFFILFLEKSLDKDLISLVVTKAMMALQKLDVLYLCVFYYLYLPCLDLKMELCYQLTILVQV